MLSNASMEPETSCGIGGWIVPGPPQESKDVVELLLEW